MFEVKIGRAAIGIAVACLTALVGCSTNSSAPATVMAQSGYSNASVTGTYAFQLVAPFDKNTPGLSYSEVGTLTFDGAGKISAGALTAYFSNSTQTCAFTVTGTYSVQSSGAATASVNAAPASAAQPAGCTAGSLSLAIEIAGSGNSFVFVDTDGSIFGGSGFKQ